VRAIPPVFLFGCLLAGAARAGELPRAKPEEVGLSAGKLDRVRSLVQDAVDRRQTAGAVVLVARRGKVAYLESIGEMDAKAGKAMRPDALFRIHSLTKPITTAAALVLYEEGKLRLDDPVSKYLPQLKGLRVHAGEGREPVPARREMTVRDLMRHTSGLTYGTPDGSPVDKLYIANKVGDPGDSLADLVGKLGRLPLLCQPGTRFHYSVSTDVLGRLIEVASGTPLDEFLRDRVFVPLDMHDTGFTVPDGKRGRFASLHRRGGKGALEVVDAPATGRYRVRPKYLSGGGGLVSTARDYARFCQMLLNGGELQGARLLRRETVREMTTNQLPPEALPMTLGGFRQPGLGFGLGVSVRMDTEASRPGPASGEYSWSGAASTYFWVAPRSEMFVVVLQQVVPFDVGLQLALRPAVYGAVQD
jgi:CubicO group peptidase (beta-lactamase class C family)